METRRFKCTATVSEIIIIAPLVLCADPTNPSSSEDSPVCADDSDLGGNREAGGVSQTESLFQVQVTT